MQDVCWYFSINLCLSYCIVYHYQTVLLARKWLNAKVSCCPAVANQITGLSNMLFGLMFLSFLLSIVFPVAGQSGSCEITTLCQIPYVYMTAVRQYPFVDNIWASQPQCDIRGKWLLYCSPCCLLRNRMSEYYTSMLPEKASKPLKA